MSGKVESMAEGKKRVGKARYNALVLKAYDDLSHAETREQLNRKAAVEMASRERL